MQSTSWEMLVWKKHELESRWLGEISTTSDIQMAPPLWQKVSSLHSLVLTKEPLDESEKGEWNVGLKLNIQKTKIMTSGSITSWKIDGETVQTVADFIYLFIYFLASKITADCDCSHEMKRRLLLGRQFLTNLDSILKSRDITLSIKVCLVKAVVFPVVMYVCEVGV